MACKRSAVRSRLPPPQSRRPGQPGLRPHKSLSSRGLGHRPFTAVTGVRIPVGTPAKSTAYSDVGRFRWCRDCPMFRDFPLSFWPLSLSRRSRLLLAWCRAGRINLGAGKQLGRTNSAPHRKQRECWRPGMDPGRHVVEPRRPVMLKKRTSVTIMLRLTALATQIPHDLTHFPGFGRVAPPVQRAAPSPAGCPACAWPAPRSVGLAAGRGGGDAPSGAWCQRRGRYLRPAIGFRCRAPSLLEVRMAALNLPMRTSCVTIHPDDRHAVLDAMDACLEQPPSQLHMPSGDDQ